jgi:multiple sugar transport system substrate-binding protein
MTFPKKILAAFSMAAILGVAVFAAPTEITYMCWYNNTETEAQGNQVLIDKYNASQDKVHVTMMAIPRDGYETKVNTMAAAGQLPDCTQLSEAMTIEFAANNLLADVSAMYLADAAPLKSLTFTYNGKPVGYSSGNEVLLLYYNKKLFDAAKLPYPPASADKAWTWKQFVDTAKKLTKDKNGKTADQKGFDAKNIVQYGADFNSPSRPCRCSADLYVKEKVAPSFADKNAMPSLDLTLLTGKIAMATSGQWEIGVSLKNSLKDGLEYGIGVLPK